MKGAGQNGGQPDGERCSDFTGCRVVSPTALRGSVSRQCFDSRAESRDFVSRRGEPLLECGEIGVQSP
jgi:hypothetical protein